MRMQRIALYSFCFLLPLGLQSLRGTTLWSAEKPFELGDLIEPFDPPSLAELEQKTDWIDQPVLDGMEVMREYLAAKGKPPLSLKRALALPNDSDLHNEQILKTLGQLAPAGGKGVDFDATLVRHVSGDLKSTNPLLISSVTEFEFQGLTSFGYLSFDRDFHYFAPSETVVSWQTSKDRLVDKFVLRDDLTWSDGKPITAHDVKFSFQVIMSDAVIVPAVRTGTDKLQWVEAYDDQTLVIFHKQPLATNTTNLSFPVIPKHIYQKSIAEDPRMTTSAYHSKLEDRPVTGGAYTLVKRARNQEFVMQRRESYYQHRGQQVRRKPYFKEVRVKVIEDANTALLALKGGQIEEMILRPEQWASQTNDESFYRRNTKVTALEWTSFHFVWNIKTPYFSDPRVRQAMSWTFDYDELFETISRGMYQRNRGTFHPTSWMFPQDGPEPYHQDLDRAEDLLDEAGWEDSDGDGIRDKMLGGKRVPFEFTMLTYQSQTGIQVATLMKECLDQIGVVCHVKPTEFTVLTQRVRDHQFQGAMGGWGSGTDPDTSTNIWVSGEGRNYGNYSNSRVDALFEQGRHEFDRKKRAAIYGEIHKLLWEDQPYTWLFYRNAFYAFSKKLRGYNFSPRGPFDYSPGFDSIYKPIASP